MSSSPNQTISELLVVGNITEANCELALKLNRSPWIMSVVGTHMVVAVLGLVAMYEYFKTKPVRKAVGLVGVNLKIISVFGFFYYVWGFASAICIYLYRLYIYLRPLEPCAYIWNGSSCYFVYSQHASVNIMGYSAFHVALLCERIYSTFIDTIRGYPPVFGLIAGFIVLLFPPYWITIHFFGYVKGNYLLDRVYCSGPVNSTAIVNYALLSSFINLLAIDVVVTLGDFLLLLYNKRQLARRISDTYTLAKSFSLHESRLSIRLIYPFSIAHSCSYCSAFIFYILYLLEVPYLNTEMDQFWREGVNLVRTFNNFLLFTVLCYVHRKQKANQHEWTRNDNEADRYFQQFNQMIS
ncbi:hypothetical protein M3Y95_00349500 [Aphelenchoides besseyi]|nr:hypothetical protein M3Y95_00349500 [Aphelenchoides besseyi]